MMHRFAVSLVALVAVAALAGASGCSSNPAGEAVGQSEAAYYTVPCSTPFTKIDTSSCELDVSNHLSLGGIQTASLHTEIVVRVCACVPVVGAPDTTPGELTCRDSSGEIVATNPPPAIAACTVGAKLLNQNGVVVGREFACPEGTVVPPNMTAGYNPCTCTSVTNPDYTETFTCTDPQGGPSCELIKEGEGQHNACVGAATMSGWTMVEDLIVPSPYMWKTDLDSQGGCPSGCTTALLPPPPSPLPY
jgi:hypothetical protein